MTVLHAGEIGRLDLDSQLSTDEHVILRNGRLLRVAAGTLDQIIFEDNIISDGDNGININDPGFEGDGVNVNGVIFAVGLRVNDIGGNHPAEGVLHRHSTTLPAALLGTRSNSDNASHADVTNGMQLFRVLGGGWAGSNYKLFGEVRISADTSGTISDTSAPGRCELHVTPDGGLTPQVAIAIENTKNVDFFGSTTLDELSATPADPDEGAEARTYVKDDKFIIQFNDSGTVRYKYLDLTGTGVTWTHTTTAP